MTKTKKKPQSDVWKSIYVHFRCQDDMIEFCTKINQMIPTNVSETFYPLYDKKMSLFKDDEEIVTIDPDKLVPKKRKEKEVDVQDQIDDAETHLKALKQEKQRIAFEQIPMLMDEMGIERVDVDGATVKLKAFVSASIPADRKQEAFNWLREHGLDDIIKNDIIVSFGRGQDNQAGDVMYDLEQKGFHPEQKTHIHSMTLKAFIREQVEQGETIDLDMFGAFVARTAEVRRNK